MRLAPRFLHPHPPLTSPWHIVFAAFLPPPYVHLVSLFSSPSLPPSLRCAHIDLAMLVLAPARRHICSIVPCHPRITPLVPFPVSLLPLLPSHHPLHYICILPMPPHPSDPSSFFRHPLLYLHVSPLCPMYLPHLSRPPDSPRRCPSAPSSRSLAACMRLTRVTPSLALPALPLLPFTPFYPSASYLHSPRCLPLATRLADSAPSPAFLSVFPFPYLPLYLIPHSFLPSRPLSAFLSPPPLPALPLLRTSPAVRCTHFLAASPRPFSALNRVTPPPYSLPSPPPSPSAFCFPFARGRPFLAEKVDAPRAKSCASRV
ncbi:hypothetical protein DFH09DRAFT_166493 [Mycena vulgaris]|nr:hypothetical protein DFH09DRAFT_166493 [Mycena vulgaris]